ncbi:MAG: ECF-type sigma factor, partial [Phycisphaerales bacterium]|nr:ECF-type sigma factor [Phycisphaerales bacterium]
MSDTREDVTRILEEMKQGDENAANKLLPLVYGEFRALARHYLAQERADHTLQPTALVHEAYMKLVDQNRVDWQSRGHFFAVAAQAMRR